MQIPHKLLNHYEEITFHRVKEVSERCAAHVFAKVRIADTLPVNNSGISDEEFSFALKAHFDFLVYDKDFQPLFAVEFDGPTHASEKQMARDCIKDSLARRFDLPVLRINANYLNQKYRDLDLLTYFVDVWFLQKAFNEAQVAGHIPWDEPFEPASVLSDGSQDKKWPFWLCIDAQAEIGKLFNAKRVASPGASCWTGIDEANRFRCLAWIDLPSGDVCFVETGMRSQNFPVSGSDVLEQIATIDLCDALNAVLQGRAKAHASNVLKAKIAAYVQRFKPWSSSIFSKPN